jgi:hypothetical protein
VVGVLEHLNKNTKALPMCTSVRYGGCTRQISRRVHGKPAEGHRPNRTWPCFSGQMAVDESSVGQCGAAAAGGIESGTDQPGAECAACFVFLGRGAGSMIHSPQLKGAVWPLRSGTAIFHQHQVFNSFSFLPLLPSSSLAQEHSPEYFRVAHKPS